MILQSCRGGFRVRQVRQATDINLDENSYD